jgi:predicted permease
LLQDLRFAGRQLARNPGFAATAVLVLALGTGASAAIFAFVDAALIQPLPYRDPARLVSVTESISTPFLRTPLSHADYLDWKKTNRSLESLDVFSGGGYMLSTPAGTELVAGGRVSAGFFRTLGVAPVRGRDFLPGEDAPGAPEAVILSHSAWRRWFGGADDVIGHAATLSGVPHTVVGVLPPSFHFAPQGRAEFWTPQRGTGPCEVRRSCHNLGGVGRLKDDVSAAAADAEMKTIARELERQYPDSNRGQGASVVALAEEIVGRVRPILLLLLGGAGLLLVIATVNVASLLLVRSESRRREIAVRGAMGASRGRLVRQFLTESLVLVAAGSGLGLAFAAWAMRLLVRLVPTDMAAGMPYLQGLAVDRHVLGFTGAVSLVAALLLCLTPIVRSPLAHMREGLAEGARGSAGTVWRRFAANLVVVELAVAVVLLVGAGLLGRSSSRLLDVGLGFEPHHVATLGVEAPPSRYRNAAEAASLAREVVARAARIPGVESAAVTSLLPVSFNGNTDWIRFVGRTYDGEHNEVNQRDVSADYFRTLQAKLLRGRFFTDAEDASKPLVVVVNRSLARRYFPDEDPIGKRFGDTSLSPGSIKEIVGIVDDIREGALDSEIWPAVYYPFNQSSDTGFSLVVRASQAEGSLLPVLRAEIRRIDSGLGMRDDATMIGRIEDSPSAYLHRSSAWLIGGFAAVALLLSVVGLYGVIAYSVSQRSREIGLRMALGAQRGTVVRMVLVQAGRLVALGIASGLTLATAAATLMRPLLFDTSPWDLSTLASVGATLAASALVASYLPARRAASVDPVVALRAE